MFPLNGWYRSEYIYIFAITLHTLHDSIYIYQGITWILREVMNSSSVSKFLKDRKSHLQLLFERLDEDNRPWEFLT